MDIYTDVVIVGTGVGGLFAALNIEPHKKVVLITKSDMESSDSFLAQGGICVERDDDDYESYFEDTMKAGHYENRKESVDIMIRSSREIIADLVSYGVEFEKENGEFVYIVKAPIPSLEFYITRMLPGRRLQVNYWNAQKNEIIFPSMNIRR